MQLCNHLSAVYAEIFSQGLWKYLLRGDETMTAYWSKPIRVSVGTIVVCALNVDHAVVGGATDHNGSNFAVLSLGSEDNNHDVA